jgi:hypothetical protein
MSASTAAQCEGPSERSAIIFVGKTRQPSVQGMYRIYLVLRRNLPTIMRRAGPRDPYGARVFRNLIFAARTAQLASLANK